MHRLDICTLTAESAWRKYQELRETNRAAAVLVLQTHFKRVEERAKAKGYRGFSQVNPLDHTAKGKR
jgi:hypothetical protein